MLMADGGGSVRVTTSVPVVPPAAPAPAPAPSAASGAAARAHQLQADLDALLARLQEAQRRAEQARQQAIAAEQKAEAARQAAAAAKAQADKTKTAADQAAAAKAQQDFTLQDARQRKATADADLADKDVALLRAQVAQKREQLKSPTGTSSAAADGKVADAQAARDASANTDQLSTLYANAQESASQAQAADAKVTALTPAPGRPIETIGPDDRQALHDAQADATRLHAQADADLEKFQAAVGTQADTQFYGTAPTPAASGTPAAAIATDPLHSPLLQLLQVTPGPATGTGPVVPFATGTTPPLFTATSPLAPSTSSPFLAPTNAPTPQVVQTLTGLADGKSVTQLAGDEHLTPDQVIAQARAAGVDIQSSPANGDVQVTTLRKGDVTLTYTHDQKNATVTVTGTLDDPGAPGGHRTITASRDAQGVFSQTVKDPKTGRDVTHQFDPTAGTRTDIVTAADGTRTATTTALTGAPVMHAVARGEGYLDVAKDAGLTPEQLLALNPEVDYGVPLEPGQQLVVSGVPTTVKTFDPDGTTLERTTAADGTLQVVATSASGRRTVLMGEADAADPTTAAVLKSLFDGKQTIAQTAAALGLTEGQVLAALPPGTVDTTPASADDAGIATRTIYDPATNRTFIETDDPRHDRTVVTEIPADQVFKVRQLDPKTGKYVMTDVAGGAGYAQQQADQQLAVANGYTRQIADLDSTIRLCKRMGEPVDDLETQRAQLVAQQKSAQGAADVAQGKATALLTKRQQVQVDQMAADAYARLFVARPGSKEQAAAAAGLKDVLALSDKVDRLVVSSDKDVGLLEAGVGKQQAHDAADAADANLQAQFEKWKDDVWMWQGIDPKTAAKMKAAGETPPMRTFSDPQQEHDAAWGAFVDLQKDLDKYGDDGLPPDELAARAAWVDRNRTSDAALAADTRYDDAATASNAADLDVMQGDLARLQQDKADWVLAHPDDFSENFDRQGDLDQLDANIANDKIDALSLGEDRKHTQYLMTVSAPDRADPDALKKAEQKYAKDNQDALTALNRQVDELQTAGARDKAKVVDAYIADWKKRNPALQAQLDALGTTTSQSSVRAAEHRDDETNALLSASEQGRQLQSATAMRNTLQSQFSTIADEDTARVQKDLDGIDKDIDGHTWVRDAWGSMFGDSSDDAKDYATAQLGKAQQLRNDLAFGKLSVSGYASQEDSFLNGYDRKSTQLERRMEDSDGTWSVVDEAVRTTVSAAAGIAATIASGGNVAVGFAVGMGVNELWDTAGDIVEAAQGRDVNADGHSSLLTLGAKAATGNASWGDVKFTLKDEAIDLASNAVTLTGVGAGARVTESLTAQLALKDTLSVGGRSLLKVGLKEGSEDTLTWGGRAIVGAGSGLTSQAVDGAGRVGVETLHVGLDGQLGTDEGDARIRGTIVSAVTGMATAPLTGAFSGAAPLATRMPGVGMGLQLVNDAGGSLGTGELVSLATNGRTMNRAEFIAASLQTLPGVLTSVAIHPSSARGRAAAAGAADDEFAGAPRTTVDTPTNDDGGVVPAAYDGVAPSRPSTGDVLPAGHVPASVQDTADGIHPDTGSAPEPVVVDDLVVPELSLGYADPSAFHDQVGLPPDEGDSGGVGAMARKFLSRKGLGEFAEAVSSTPRVKRHNTSSWITGRVRPGDYAKLDVPVRGVRSQHSVDGPAVAKTAARATAVRDWLEANPDATRLDMPTLDEIAGSTGSIKVGLDDSGRAITLDGVGRLEAVKSALAQYAGTHGAEHPLVDVEVYGVRLTDRESAQLHRTSDFFRDADGVQRDVPEHDLVPFTAVPRFVAGTALNIAKKAFAPVWQKFPFAEVPDRRIPLALGPEGGDIGSADPSGAWSISYGGAHALASQVNPTGSRTNCVNCAVTYDRMAATPGLELSAVPSGPKGLAQVEAVYGHLPTRAFADGADATGFVAGLPEGARGFVVVRGGDRGHILNFSRTAGGSEFVDAQAGREVTGFDAPDVFVMVTGQGGGAIDSDASTAAWTTLQGDEFAGPPPANAGGTPAPAPLPPATTRRVATSATLGAGMLAGLGVGAFEVLPPHVAGTALTWALVGSAMRGGIKLARFSQAGKWEGRFIDMRRSLGPKATFERALNEFGRLGDERAQAGADPGDHAAFTQALGALRERDPLARDPLARTIPWLRQRRLGAQVDTLHASAKTLGIDPAVADALAAKLHGGVVDRARFDRRLAQHAGFASRVELGTRGNRARLTRLLTGIDDAKVTDLKGRLAEMDNAFGLLRDKDPDNDPQAMTQLEGAVKNLSIAPRLREAKTAARWTIDGVQFGTYAISLGALAHAVASFPHDWPGTVVSGVFAVSTLADGVKTAGVRIGSAFQPADRAPVSQHVFFEKTLPSADELATKYGAVGTLVKAVATGDGYDIAAAAVYLFGARRQRADSVARDYKDPDAGDTATRKKMLGTKAIAAGAALLLAGDAAAHSLFATSDDDRKKRPPPGGVTPTPGITPTPGATPGGTPTPGVTSSPGASTAPPTSTPSTAPGTPPPAHRAPLVVVDSRNPQAATLWAIANAHEDSLLTRRQVDAAHGGDAETAQALRQLFQLNPQRGFRPALMDGVASAVPGDPDTVRPGWRIDVDNPAVSGASQPHPATS